MAHLFETSVAGRARRSMKRAPLLELDPQLGGSMPPEELRRAQAALPVRTVSLPVGSWEPPSGEHRERDLGLLVTEGLLVREVILDGSRGMELLGEGDVLRPWQEDAASFCASRWRVLSPARLAVLDERLVASLAEYPSLVVALSERIMRRSRWLAIEVAVSNLVGIEKRVLALFWQLAERWGRLQDGRVVLSVKLTHAIIADMVGSRRPSVTQALNRLVEEGKIEQVSDGCWCLRGMPPAAVGTESGCGDDGAHR